MSLSIHEYPGLDLGSLQCWTLPGSLAADFLTLNGRNNQRKEEHTTQPIKSTQKFAWQKLEELRFRGYDVHNLWVHLQCFTGTFYDTLSVTLNDLVHVLGGILSEEELVCSSIRHY